MDTKSTIGVVTVLYNSAPVLPGFILSLQSQTYSRWTLYAVDNASEDNAVEMLRGSEQRTVVIENGANLGVAEGNNIGIRAATRDGCQFVLLLNNDTEFDADLFARLLEALADSNCDMIAPKINYFDHPDTIWAAGGNFEAHLGYRIQHRGMDQPDDGSFDQQCRISYAPTCCVLIRAEVFERVGLMDAQYFVYGDDVDFMYRAMMAGITMLYLPTARLLHKVHSSTGGSSSFTLYYCTRNRIYFLRKNLGFFTSMAWIFVYELYFVGRFVLHCDQVSAFKLKQKALWSGLQMQLPYNN